MRDLHELTTSVEVKQLSLAEIHYDLEKRCVKKAVSRTVSALLRVVL